MNDYTIEIQCFGMIQHPGGEGMTICERGRPESFDILHRVTNHETGEIVIVGEWEDLSNNEAASLADQLERLYPKTCAEFVGGSPIASDE